MNKQIYENKVAKLREKNQGFRRKSSIILKKKSTTYKSKLVIL